MLRCIVCTSIRGQWLLCDVEFDAHRLVVHAQVQGLGWHLALSPHNHPDCTAGGASSGQPAAAGIAALRIEKSACGTSETMLNT